MHPTTLKLRSYQREALDAIELSLLSHTRVACVLPTGAGKGHPLDTEVPTPDGLRIWGDLKVGDYVYGSDGQPTRVTGVYDRGVLPIYTVAFKHGESVQVDGDHLWQVQRRKRKPQVLSTRELATERMRDRDGYRWAVPVAGAVHRYSTTLPLHPYVVGSLIANGCLTGDGTQLTTPDPEVAMKCAEFTKVNPVNDTTPGVCPRYSLPGLTAVTRELGMRVHSGQKRIPRPYLEGELVQRVMLLRGLLDGDGSSRTGGRRSLNYSTTSRELAFDVKELVTSLSGTCSIRLSKRDHHGKSDEYTCGILLRSSMRPFATTRRDQVEQPRRTFEPRNTIISIFRSGEAEIRCISVAAEDSLYLITRNHIVTHNTVLFAHLIEKAHSKGRKALVLVHREELAEQAKAKVHSVAPRLSVGIVKASRNEVDADVIVASVQTLARPERRQSVLDAGEIGLVICDEAHHASARTWVEVLADFGCFRNEALDAYPDLRGKVADPVPCVGFTATLTRQDGKGLGDIWEEVAYEKDILWMIDNGYLTDVRGTAVTVEGLDLATIARSRGDYQEGQLGEALEASGAGEVIAKAYIEHASGPDGLPRRGILFAPTVRSAYSFAEDLNRAGISAETIEGNTPSEDRALSYKRFEAGDTRVLASVGVLTEGFDAPWAEVCVVARPTQSPSLWTQMVGRVLRPWPGKTEALVLDVVGIAGRHKLQSLTDLVKTTVLDGESLSEARLRIDQEMAERSEVSKLSGIIAAKQVELFANSHSAWLQTKGGRWFLPVSAGIFFLWPALPEEGDAPGTWRVGYVRQGKPRWGSREAGWVESGMTLEYAMAWGEALAEEDDPTVSLKDRAWRKKKPSEAQIGYALQLGCVDAETAFAVRKGELSDRISIHLASRQLDR